MVSVSDNTNLSVLVGRYYEKKTLEVLVPELRLYEIANKYNVPLNSGNAVYFRKWTEFTAPAPNLTEGTSPSAAELSASGVNVTLKQRGVFHTVSDIFDMTAVNPVVDEAIQYVISPRLALSVDKEILWRLTGQVAGYSLEGFDPVSEYAGSTVLSQVLDGQQGGLSTLYLSADGRKFVSTFANFSAYFSALGIAAATTAVSQCIPSAKVLRAAVAVLRGKNVKPDSDGYFSLVCHPQVASMIASDPEFVAWSQFQYADKGKKNYIGEFAGVKVLPSTAMIVTQGGTLSVGSFSTVGLSVAISLLTGQGAFGVTELAGQGGVKVIAKRPSNSDTSNPLDLFSTVGGKITIAATVLNPKCAVFLVNTVGLA